MKDFKFKTSFSSTVKPLVSEEKDKYLALASLVDIGDFVPDIDMDKNVDLLPVAFNACVANRVNKNGDVIDTKTAKEICEGFINKPINIEHNRQRVIGVILTAGYSEFGTDKPFTFENEATEDHPEPKNPFNITLGGVIWRVTSSEIADLIEDSSDPLSENYLSISASWELGFDQYNLIILNNEEKDIERAEVISDPNSIEEMQDSLRSMGGSGELEDGRKIYRQVIGEVLPLGIGLTQTPAADVKGILVHSKIKASEDAEETIIEKTSNIKKNISQTEEKTVNNSRNEFSEKNKINIMKINSLKDITDESLKTMSASVVSDFIEEEMKDASEKWSAEKHEVETKLQEAQDNYAGLSEESEKLKQELEQLKTSLETLEQEKASKEAEEKFNSRMSAMDEEYVLSDKDREVLAQDIKDLSDEDFEAYETKMKILMEQKSKKFIEARELEEKEKATAEAPAKVEVQTETKVEEDAEVVVDKVIDQAEMDKDDMPNTSTAEEDNLVSRYEKAFNIQEFEIQY